MEDWKMRFDKLKADVGGTNLQSPWRRTMGHRLAGPSPTTADRWLRELHAEKAMRAAEGSLIDFVRLFWPVLEPGVPFATTWHLELLAEYLEAVTAGRITRILINMPPRHGKSLLATVFWPVWEWLRKPSHRWMFVTGVHDLALRQSLDRRRLLERPDILARYPQLALVR